MSGKSIEQQNEELKNAAYGGDADAMYEYASVLFYGKNRVPVNKKEVARLFKMSTEKGNTGSIFSYGLMLSQGEGVPVNKKEAVRYLKMWIEKGNSDCMNSYAKMLQEGDGVPSDSKEASRLYKMAIAKGNIISMNNYANCWKMEKVFLLTEKKLKDFTKMEKWKWLRWRYVQLRKHALWLK